MGARGHSARRPQRKPFNEAKEAQPEPAIGAISSAAPYEHRTRFNGA